MRGLGQARRWPQCEKANAPRKATGQRGRRIGNKRASSLAGHRLDIIATLRNAAPWQPLRRKLGGTDRMVVTRDDFRVARIKQRNEATAIFAVDASGSTAFQRLAEAKGAVETILAECYVRRDKVAPGCVPQQEGGIASAAHALTGTRQARTCGPAWRRRNTARIGSR